MGCCCSQPVDKNRKPTKKGNSSDIVKLIEATETGKSDRLDGEMCSEPQSAVEGGEAVTEPFQEMERSLSESMAVSKDERYWSVDLKG